MSGTSEVLQEYLVKLGFKVDQGELKKFQDSLGTVGKRVMGIGLGVAGVVASVEAASAAFAYSMRKVYFDSQLAGSSVKNLKALEYAGSQVGISADAMASSIHSMAQQLRLNPGLRGVIESFGVKVEGRDVSDVMQDYVKALGSMPEFQAAQFAGMFGMDPDTYHQMRNNMDEIIAKTKEMKDVYKSLGTDMDEAAKTSLHYANNLDNVKMHFGALETAILTGAAPAFDKLTAAMVRGMDITTKWMNLPVRGSFLAEMGIALGFRDAHDANHTAGTMGVESHLTPYAREHMKALGLLRTSAAAPGTPLSAAERAKMGGAHAAGVAGAASSAGTGHVNRNERNNNPGNIEYGPWAIAHGATGTDGRFAIFPTMASGYMATQALLSQKGAAGMSSVGSLISSWAPSNENNTSAYSAYVAKQMGVGVGDKLDMKNPETVAQLSKYIAQYEGLSSGALGGVQGLRLGTGVSVSNVFHITGSNANEIAGKVAGAQNRTYQDALRDSQGAAR